MTSEPRQLLNHRQAIIQNRRSALPSRGCGCLRCRTSNCCRRQRFSAISRTLGLNAAAIAQTRKRTSRPPTNAGHSRGAKACDCQPRSPWTAILRPTAGVATSTARRSCWQSDRMTAGPGIQCCSFLPRSRHTISWLLTTNRADRSLVGLP